MGSHIGLYLDSGDVNFGTTVGKRNAAVDRLEHNLSSAISSLSVRLAYRKQNLVLYFLAAIQAKYTHMAEPESFCLQNIARVSEDLQVGCKFRNIALHIDES